jgi:hypothetical protein
LPAPIPTAAAPGCAPDDAGLARARRPVHQHVGRVPLLQQRRELIDLLLAVEPRGAQLLVLRHGQLHRCLLFRRPSRAQITPLFEREARKFSCDGSIVKWIEQVWLSRGPPAL